MTTLATFEHNPYTAIVQLLGNDPRLASKHTTRQYKSDLFNFENWRHGRAITKTLVEEYAAKLQEAGLAPSTINQRLAAIRWYARKIADLALTIVADIHKFSLDGKTNCDIRIGIHAGPVIAGVIGSKKFSYDVWGDAVNTASRMESFSEPGKIQISEKFYDYIKNEYECEYRGQTEIKSKGAMNLYFLLGKKHAGPVT